jgi:hypothetical protein
MKYLEIESQIMMDTDVQLDMLKTILRLGKEAGYTHVKDHWGVQAHDEYTIDEAIEKFNIKFPYPDEELPF